MNLNTVILAGHLSQDPAPGARGHSLCTFTLSFEGPFGLDRGASTRRRGFIPVVAFGRTAEACLGHLKKGSRVVVDGRLREDQWQTRVGGTHSRMTLVCDRIHFVSGLRKDPSPGAGGPPLPALSDPPGSGV
jgi:single-strand DNA-binding protein